LTVHLPAQRVDVRNLHVVETEQEIVPIFVIAGGWRRGFAKRLLLT
jgi:hypothetical protein